MSEDAIVFRRREVMMMGAGLAVIPLTGWGGAGESMPEGSLPPGREQPFDLGWRFFRGAGEGFEAPSLDDSRWRTLDLPHDWSVEDVPGGPGPDRIGPFDRSAEGGTDAGFTVGGEGWYRKRFLLPDLPGGARVEIHFDGVSVVSDVWLNGRPVGHHVHGYTPFACDLTPHIRRGAENVLAVRVRNIGHNSRWYAGSGIYRPVAITVLPESARIARWGVAAWTRRIDEKGADIEVTTRLEDAGEGLTLITRLKDESGRVVAESASPAGAEVRHSLELGAPNLWSPDHPNLYALETVLARGDSVVDGLAQPFGVRIVTMDAKHGLRINGESVRLQGGCVHHDNGLLGAAAFAGAEERRVLRLKERGFNAIRSAHNPSSRAFRHACDRHGMLLIEESFDVWHSAKLPDDYSVYFEDHWQEDVRAMVLSARNSPSVIMWSIGNEIPERSTPAGVEWSWKLANDVRRLDPTRPVTAAIHGFPGRPLIAAKGTAPPGTEGEPHPASTIFLDVVGYNYKLDDIEADHSDYPERVFYGSETFPKDAFDYRQLTRKAPYMLGEFVWTAMDYLGEAGIGLTRRIPADGNPYIPHQFPVVGAYCGDIDLIGEQKPQSLARDVVWGISPLEVTVARPLAEGMIEQVPPWGWPEELPSWTWPGEEGRSLAVRVYTSGDRVELRLNGKVVATRALTADDKMRAEIEVPYSPGTLEAVAYREGAEIARRVLRTAAKPAALRLTPEKPVCSSDRHSLIYVGVEVLDAEGRWVPEAAESVRLVTDGPAELIGFGSASPLATGSLQSKQAVTYQGRALMILRATGEKGVARIQGHGDGLEAGEATVRLV